MINFAKNVMFSTSMPYTDIYALEACLSVISSPRGEEVQLIATIVHTCSFSTPFPIVDRSLKVAAEVTPSFPIRTREDIYFPEGRSREHPCVGQLRCHGCGPES